MKKTPSLSGQLCPPQGQSKCGEPDIEPFKPNTMNVYFKHLQKWWKRQKDVSWAEVRFRLKLATKELKWRHNHQENDDFLLYKGEWSNIGNLFNDIGLEPVDKDANLDGCYSRWRDKGIESLQLPISGCSPEGKIYQVLEFWNQLLFDPMRIEALAKPDRWYTREWGGTEEEDEPNEDGA